MAEVVLRLRASYLAADWDKYWKGHIPQDLEIDVFSDAEVIAGPAGAGFANIVHPLDQAGEARGLRLHQLTELPRPLTALHGEAQLGRARDDHAPLKSEAPPNLPRATEVTSVPLCSPR